MKSAQTLNAIGAFVLLSASASQGALTIYSDDFTTSAVSNNKFRVYLNQPDIWAAGGTNPAGTSNWNVSGGTLNNPVNAPDGAYPTYVANEGPVMRLTPVTSIDTTLTKIRVKFDYNVGVGTTTYFHLWGLATNGTPDANEQLANLEAGNGGTQNLAETDFADISILTGTDPNGGTGGAVALTGSGTYDMTFDLGTYAWSADEGVAFDGVTIGNITAFENLVYGWGNDATVFDGSGAVSIGNFVLEAVPEPSSVALLGLGSLGLFLRRRR